VRLIEAAQRKGEVPVHPDRPAPMCSLTRR
jgi:hypothetical protein